MGARKNGREEGAGGLGEEDEMTKILRLFESFEKGVLGSFVQCVGGSDNEEAVASFATIGEGEKFADLFNGNQTSGF